MRVLVACEFTGRVRDAFTRHGADAWSCDLIKNSETPGPHIRGNVLDHLSEGWDMMVAFPPCTHLAISGSRWFKYKSKAQVEALDFFQTLLDAPIKHIAVENPIGIASTRIREPDQIIQPWQFGDEFTKSTCLWLKNLPKLVPTKIVSKGEFEVLIRNKGTPTRPELRGRTVKIPKWYYDISQMRDQDRGRLKSRTFPGIAEAMADQWTRNLSVQASL